MRTVVLGPMSPQLEADMARRRDTGADIYDEVWEGEYHMAPAPSGHHARVDDEMAAALRGPAQAAGLFGSGPFNLGEPDDYRVPDRGLHRQSVLATWVPTAALVVEIVSPDDESWQKLEFYAVHQVDEVVIVDPADRSITWLALAGTTYTAIERSGVLDVAAAEVAESIGWP